MSKIQIPKRIRQEDFDSKDQSLIGKLADIINIAFEEIYNLTNGNIDFSNLNRQLVATTVTMDDSGAVIGTPQIKLTINTKPVGLNVIKAVNINALGTFPTQAPFVSFSFSNNILSITNIIGLQAGSQYQLTLEIIG